MIRVSATLVGILLGLTLAALVFLAGYYTRNAALRTVLLPVCAAVGGYVAGRWSERGGPSSGFAVALFSLATRAGLGLGLGGGLLAFVQPQLALLEIAAALAGGITGALAARRATPQSVIRPELTSL